MIKKKVICFSGPDGAGKSTVFLMANQMLREKGVKLFVMRQYQVMTATILNLKRVMTGKRKSFKAEVGRLGYSDIKRDRDTGSFLWRIRRFVGLFIGLIDINIFGRMFVAIKRIQGYTVIVEQAPLDIFVKRHRPQFKIMEFLFAKYLPKTSCAVLCCADPREITQRKPELNEREILEYYYRINHLYAKSSEFKKVDLRTDSSIEDTKKDLQKILDRLLTNNN